MRRLLIFSVSLAALAAVAGCAGEKTAGREPVLSADQRIAISRVAAPLIEKSFGGRLDHPAVQAYVRTVGERVARSLAGGGFPYQFFVLDTPVAAAVALPGGQVYVTRGLLMQLETEGELAGLLGHELAHITAGHGEHIVGVTALAEAADKVPVNGPLPTGAAGRMIDEAVKKLLYVQYSAEMEKEADRLGLDYMVAAGYYPGEMVRLATTFGALAGPDAAWFRNIHTNPAGRADAVRQAVGRKYVDQAGRVGRQEYQREVLDRLKAG
jgi:predicted Zn-dependent protease